MIFQDTWPCTIRRTLQRRPDQCAVFCQRFLWRLARSRKKSPSQSASKACANRQLLPTETARAGYGQNCWLPATNQARTKATGYCLDSIFYKISDSSIHLYIVFRIVSIFFLILIYTSYGACCWLCLWSQVRILVHTRWPPLDPLGGPV